METHHLHREDVIPSNFRVDRQYKWNNGDRVEDGYEVSQTVLVKVGHFVQTDAECAVQTEDTESISDLVESLLDNDFNVEITRIDLTLKGVFEIYAQSTPVL